MKKLLIALLMLGSMQMIEAKSSIDKVFKELESCPEVDIVSIPRLFLRLGNFVMTHTDDEDGQQVGQAIKKIKGLKVINVEKNDHKTILKVEKALKHLNGPNYDDLVRVKDDGDQVRIIAHRHKESYDELVIIADDKEDCALVLFKGYFTEKDFNELIEYQND